MMLDAIATIKAGWSDVEHALDAEYEDLIEEMNNPDRTNLGIPLIVTIKSAILSTRSRPERQYRLSSSATPGVIPGQRGLSCPGRLRITVQQPAIAE